MEPLGMRVAVVLALIVGGTALKWNTPEYLEGFVEDARPDYPLNITAFMNTREPIWTYNTTMNTKNIACKVDVMVNISDEMINFNRSFYYKGEKSGYGVEGTFFPYPPRKPYAILFGGPGLLKQGYELIINASRNYSCAVLNVTLVWGREVEDYWFDLRVRNSSIEVGPTSDCMEYYKNVTKKYRKRSQGLYNATCQHVLSTPAKNDFRLSELILMSREPEDYLEYLHSSY